MTRTFSIATTPVEKHPLGPASRPSYPLRNDNYFLRNFLMRWNDQDVASDVPFMGRNIYFFIDYLPITIYDDDFLTPPPLS